MSDYSGPEMRALDNITETAFMLTCDAPTVQTMMQDLITRAEPADVTELRKTHPKLDEVMADIDSARATYGETLQARQQGLLDAWNKDKGLTQKLLRQLLGALVMQLPNPMPATFASIATKVQWPKLQASWQSIDSKIKSETQTKTSKQVQEQRTDPSWVAQERCNLVDKEFAQLINPRSAMLNTVGYEADTLEAKRAFLLHNVVWLDFLVELYDLVRPSSGVVDISAITASILEGKTK